MATDIEHLNDDCTCVTLDRDRLCSVLTEIVGDETFCRGLAETHGNLVSAQPLFLNAQHAAQMLAIVRAIETVAELPAYREAVLAHAPPIARHCPGPVGVFMGYDFHLGRNGPRLIEINTNAGGALVNAYVKAAQRVCCAEMAVATSAQLDLESTLSLFVESFRSEWQRQGRSETLRSIAIVDREPRGQYLYPELVLFQRLLERHGIATQIAGPELLEHRSGGLWIGDRCIDLVYNRLTDFDLSEAGNAALRSAYVSGDVVVTPSPWAHAQFADKRNLTLLCDRQRLDDWGVPAAVAATLLEGIPRTVVVDPSNAELLWSNRGRLFFKPCAGYGSKAAYRGDKITRKVWSEILASSYVAQDTVPPSSRTISIDGTRQTLKADLRCYTYAGRQLLLAARLYQGQTTNFRTPGGGFSPVFVGQGEASCRC